MRKQAKKEAEESEPCVKPVNAQLLFLPPAHNLENPKMESSV
jgi:hypothetical protein